MKSDTIKSFHNLVFHAMPVPNTGCIATGTLTSGFDITVTGGNTGQMADGIDQFLVEVVDSKIKHPDTGEPKLVTKKNMSRDELSLLIEHHYKNRNRRKRRRSYAAVR